MAEPWRDRLASVGQGLLTLEINTVVTTGLSAQKMPEVPLALHNLVQAYGDYLAVAGFQVTNGLRDAAARRVSGQSRTAGDASLSLLRNLQAWPFPDLRRWTKPEQDAHLPDVAAGIAAAATDADKLPLAEPTNGAEMFEALQWAAWAALQSMRAGLNLPADISVISRIYANCRQIKEAAARLEAQHGPETQAQSTAGGQSFLRSAQSLKTRLAAAAPAVAPARARTDQLFGATVEETAQALFAHPRPVFYVDPDVTVLIRKAWDIGVQRICMQSAIQVDGDILQSIADMRKDDRDFLVDLHRTAVKDSMAQWKAMLDIILTLAKDVGSLIFGGRGA